MVLQRLRKEREGWKGWVGYPAAKQAIIPAMRVENCMFAYGEEFFYG